MGRATDKPTVIEADEATRIHKEMPLERPFWLFRYRGDEAQSGRPHQVASEVIVCGAKGNITETSASTCTYLKTPERTLIFWPQPAHLEHSHARRPAQLEAVWQLASSLAERIEQAAPGGQGHGAPRVAQRTCDLTLPFQLDERCVPAQPGVLLQQAEIRPLRGDEGVIPRVAEKSVREGRLDRQAGCVADAGDGTVSRMDGALPGMQNVRHGCGGSDFTDVAQNAVVCEFMIAESAERLLLRASRNVRWSGRLSRPGGAALAPSRRVSPLVAALYNSQSETDHALLQSRSGTAALWGQQRGVC